MKIGFVLFYLYYSFYKVIYFTVFPLYLPKQIIL